MESITLFLSLRDQLIFYKNGNYKKYQDIFERSVKLSGLQLENIGLSAYYYFDFLESVGLIESFGQGNSRRWTFTSQKFSHDLDNKRITLPKAPSIKGSPYFLFEINFNLFPPFDTELQNEKTQTDIFLEKLQNLALGYDSLKEIKIRSHGHVLVEYKYIQYYDTIFNKWVQVTSYSNDGLYKVGYKSFESFFFIKCKSQFFEVLDDEWAFIFAQDLTSQGLLSKNLFQNASLTIPTKFKIPTLMKRVLLASASKVYYGKTGTHYTLTKLEYVDHFLKNIGFYKGFAA